MALLLLGVVLLLITTAAVTVLLRPRGRLDASVHAGVLATALAATTVLLTGWAGALRPGPMLALHAVEAAAATVVVLRRGLPGRPGLLPWRAVLGAPWAAGLVLAAGLALAWQLLVALVLPPYAYDGLTYHLTTVAGWLQTGDLAPSPLSLCCAYYPAGAELVLAWPVVLLGSDGVVGAVQVAAALLAASAAAGIGRTAGLSRSGAAAVGALVVLMPALLAQAPTPYVDVLLAALVLAGLHGLARFAATARPLALVVPGLCAGLLTGTKGTGLLWAVALGLTALVVAIAHTRRGRLTIGRALTAVGGVAGACVLLGGWWYVRAAVDTGNPLHPFELRLGGRVLLSGPRQVADVLTAPDAGAGQPFPVAVVRSWASDLLPWRQGSYDYQQRSGGLGPLWVWLGLPLLVPLAHRLWRRRDAALVALVPVLAVLAVQPYRWWARFTLPLGALGLIAVVVAVERLRPGVLRGGLQAATAALALAGAVLVLVEVDPASQAPPLRADRVLALVGAPAGERTVGEVFLPEYAFLDDVPRDAVVLVDLEADAVRFVFPLFGRELGRSVLPLGEDPPPEDAWVVTGEGRPAAEALTLARGAPASDVRGVQVWRPLP